MRKTVAIIIALGVISSCLHQSEGLSQNDFHGLTNELLKNYDKWTPPSLIGSQEPTNVTVSFTLKDVHIREEGSMTLDVWVSQKWSDPRLNLSALENNSANISTFYTEPSNIWLPDISIYNHGVFEAETLPKSPYQVVIQGGGDIIYIAPISLEIGCELDFSMWPYDTHSCTGKYGSWVYSGFVVDLNISSSRMEMELQGVKDSSGPLTKGGWIIQETYIERKVVFYACCPEPYVSLEINVVVQRQTPSLKNTIQIPAFALCLFLLVIFMLPPGAPEKAVIGSMGVLMNLIFLIYMSYKAPNVPEKAPLLVSFVTEQLITSVAMVIISIVTLRIARDPHHEGKEDQKDPSSSHSCWSCLSPSMLLCGLCNYRPSKNGMQALPTTEDSDSFTKSSHSTHSSAYKYLVMAALIDRIILVVYLLNIIGVAVSYSPHLF